MMMLSVQSEFNRQLRHKGKSNCLYYWQSELHWEQVPRQLIRWKPGLSFEAHYQDIIMPELQNVAIFSARKEWISQVSGYKTAQTTPLLWGIIILMVWLAGALEPLRKWKLLVMGAARWIWGGAQDPTQSITIHQRASAARTREGIASPWREQPAFQQSLPVGKCTYFHQCYWRFLL